MSMYDLVRFLKHLQLKGEQTIRIDSLLAIIEELSVEDNDKRAA